MRVRVSTADGARRACAAPRRELADELFARAPARVEFSDPAHDVHVCWGEVEAVRFDDVAREECEAERERYAEPEERRMEQVMVVATKRN